VNNFLIHHDSRNNRGRKHFNLHRFLVNTKVMAIEIAATLVFLNWLARILIHELWK
jgi:hypothetical protein